MQNANQQTEHDIRESERQRVRAILLSDEGLSQPTFATDLAINSKLDASEALELLGKSMPANSAPNWWAMAMYLDQPDVDAGFESDEATGSDLVASSIQLFENFRPGQ